MLAVAIGVWATPCGAIADINATPNGPPSDAKAGPLIIQIVRRSELSQGTPDAPRQVRCLLQWVAGEGDTRGRYAKQCSTSQLPR